MNLEESFHQNFTVSSIYILYILLLVVISLLLVILFIIACFSYSYSSLYFSLLCPPPTSPSSPSVPAFSSFSLFLICSLHVYVDCHKSVNQRYAYPSIAVLHEDVGRFLNYFIITNCRTIMVKLLQRSCMTAISYH